MFLCRWLNFKSIEIKMLTISLKNTPEKTQGNTEILSREKVEI